MGDPALPQNLPLIITTAGDITLYREFKCIHLSSPGHRIDVLFWMNPLSLYIYSIEYIYIYLFIYLVIYLLIYILIM